MEGLSTERISRLENWPGWTWDTQTMAWEEGFSALEKYVAREGHARVPTSHSEEEFKLGRWVRDHRSSKERLLTERISRLENLPGWTWNRQEAAWEEGFFALEKYVSREGHVLVPSFYIEEGFKLGQWVKRRQNGKERLSTERISRLEALPAWVWAK